MWQWPSQEGPLQPGLGGQEGRGVCGSTGSGHLLATRARLPGYATLAQRPDSLGAAGPGFGR